MHIRDGYLPSLPRPERASIPREVAEPADRFVPGATPIDDGPPLGASRTFWTWDFSIMPPGARHITATLRAVGEHGAIWVDDAAWGHTVNEQDVAILDERFNRKAGAGAVDPRQGIYDITTRYFGDMPTGIDSDTRATILITEMAAFQGTTLDGYFNAFDQLTDAEAMEKYGQHSNEKNMIYLNSSGSRVSDDYMVGVLAHEFSHLLQFGKATDASAWLGETMGEVAMAVTGYHTDMGHIARHQSRPERPLVSDTYVDYGASYLFGTYLLERYGQSFIQELLQGPPGSTDVVDRALARRHRPETFSSLLNDWVVANWADAQGVVAPGYHYASLDVPAPTLAGTVADCSEPVSKTLPPTGAAYIGLELSARSAFQLEADGAVHARLLRVSNGQLAMQTVVPGTLVEAQPGDVLAVVCTADAPVQYRVGAVPLGTR